MLRLPKPVLTCPSCPAQVGEPHDRDCISVLCLTTGTPRIQHSADPPAGDHECGDAVWTGFPNGSVEAVAAGLFVRMATVDDLPFTGWLPCGPDDTDAVPDLHRVMLSGRWNPAVQAFELPTSVSR